MSDLQCPAIFRLAAIEDAAERSGCTILDVTDAAGLRRRIDELADLHRGETVAVLAPRALLEETVGAPPVTIAVDADGWRRA